MWSGVPGFNVSKDFLIILFALSLVISTTAGEMSYNEADYNGRETRNPSIIVVSSDGTGDYRSIQAAIDNASEGDTDMLAFFDYGDETWRDFALELWEQARAELEQVATAAPGARAPVVE